MLNVKSLYTNIGSQFTPFVTLPTKKINVPARLFSHNIPRNKKNSIKMCTN